MSELFTTLKNYRSYQREYKMRTLILLGIVLVNLGIFALGVLGMKILPENAGKSTLDIMKYSLKLLVDSGGFMDNTTGIVSVILTVLIVVAGMICFTGGIIAYMSNAVTNLVDNANRGNNKLKLQEHIVIVNWNRKGPLLIADYLRKEERQYIVVLTDKDKEEVLSEIDKKVHDLLKEEKSNNNVGMKLPRVIVRNAQEFTSKDLDSICITDAASVLVLSPEDKYDVAGCDAYVIKQYMLLISYFAEFLKIEEHDLAYKIGIIVEIQLAHNTRFINDYPLPLDDGIDTIEPVGVNCNEILGKIMALAVIKPSLHSTILELLSYQGSEIYSIIPMDADYDSNDDIMDHLVAYEKQLITCDYSIPLFEIDDYHRAFLLEDSNYYQFEDNEVGNSTLDLFEEVSDADITKWNLKKKIEKSFGMDTLKINKNILIIGSNERLVFVLQELVKFCTAGVCISLGFTSEKQRIRLTKLINDRFNEYSIKLENMADEFSDESICACIRDYSDILVLSDPNDEVIEDRIPILFWNVITRNHIQGKNILVEVLNPENKDIVKSSTVPGNYFISNQYVSGMFTQLGVNINLYKGITELLTLQSDKNIWSYKVNELFDEYEMQFVSKKELILWTYKYTSGKYVPIGIIKEGITYLLTNGAGTIGAELCPGNWDGGNGILQDVIKLDSEDEIIVIER